MSHQIFASLSKNPQFSNNSFYNYDICNLTQNGIYIYSREFISNLDSDQNEPGGLWKYNFTTKMWLEKHLPDKQNKLSMKCSEHGNLLFLTSDRNPDYKFNLILYDPGSEECKNLAVMEPFLQIHFPTLLCVADGKVFTISFNYEHSKLFAYHLNHKEWEELCDIPKHFGLDKMSAAIWMNKKLYLFSSFLRPTIWPSYVYVYDITRHGLSKLETHQWSLNDHQGMSNIAACCRCFISEYNGSAYFIDMYEAQNRPFTVTYRKIYILHLSSLTWSELPIILPKSRLFLLPIIKKDGTMHLFCEDGIHQINLSDQPRSLQDICWDFIIDYPRSRPLASYTDEELFNRGIQKIFITKLRW